MSIIKVNRSGSAKIIYTSNACTEQKGTLNNNELFAWVEEWNGSSASGYYAQFIKFRNSAGKVDGGWVPAPQSSSIFTNICSLPKFTKVINGQTFYGFRARRKAYLFKPDGTATGGAVESGCNILCKSSTGGQSNPTWLAAYYIENAPGSNTYSEIVKGSYGFVNLALESGSMFNSNATIIGSI